MKLTLQSRMEQWVWCREDCVQD